MESKRSLNRPLILTTSTCPAILVLGAPISLQVAFRRRVMRMSIITQLPARWVPAPLPARAPRVASALYRHSSPSTLLSLYRGYTLRELRWRGPGFGTLGNENPSSDSRFRVLSTSEKSRVQEQIPCFVPSSPPFSYNSWGWSRQGFQGLTRFGCGYNVPFVTRRSRQAGSIVFLTSISLLTSIRRKRHVRPFYC